MTAAQMEARLLELSASYARTGDQATRAEYRALHARWMEAKR